MFVSPASQVPQSATRKAARAPPGPGLGLTQPSSLCRGPALAPVESLPFLSQRVRGARKINIIHGLNKDLRRGWLELCKPKYYTSNFEVLEYFLVTENNHHFIITQTLRHGAVIHKLVICLWYFTYLFLETFVNFPMCYRNFEKILWNHTRIISLFYQHPDKSVEDSRTFRRPGRSAAAACDNSSQRALLFTQHHPLLGATHTPCFAENLCYSY